MSKLGVDLDLSINLCIYLYIHILIQTTHTRTRIRISSQIVGHNTFISGNNTTSVSCKFHDILTCRSLILKQIPTFYGGCLLKEGSTMDFQSTSPPMSIYFVLYVLEILSFLVSQHLSFSSSNTDLVVLPFPFSVLHSTIHFWFPSRSQCIININDKRWWFCPMLFGVLTKFFIYLFIVINYLVIKVLTIQLTIHII